MMCRGKRGSDADRYAYWQQKLTKLEGERYEAQCARRPFPEASERALRKTRTILEEFNRHTELVLSSLCADAVCCEHC